jgi:hypothetical protein
MNEKLPHKKVNRFIYITAKTIVIILLSVVLVLVLVIGLVQVPFIQDKIKTKVVKGLAEKWHTRVSIGHVSLNFRGYIVVSDVFIADQQNDTLVSVGKIQVGINAASLLNKQLIVNRFFMGKGYFHYQVKDTAHTNIDFIVNSFKDTVKKEPASAKSPWTISVKKIELQNIFVRYQSVPDSSGMDLNTGKLTLEFSETNLEKMKFGIRRFLLANTSIIQNSYAIIPKTANTKPGDKTAGKNSKSASPLVSIREIVMDNVEYTQKAVGSERSFKLNHANLTGGNIDMQHKSFSLNKLSIQNGTVSVHQPSRKAEARQTNENPAIASSSATPGWSVTVGDVDLGFDRITLENLMPNNPNYKYLKTISLKDIVVRLSAKYEGTKWVANLKQLEFTDERTRQRTSIAVKASSRNELIVADLFQFSTGKTFIKGRGKFSMPSDKGKSGIPDFDITIGSSLIRKKDLLAYVSDSLQVALNRMPDTIRYSGHTVASNGGINTTNQVYTNIGNIELTGKITDAANVKTSPYSMVVLINKLQAGYLAKNATLGQVTGSVQLEGVGLSPKARQAHGIVRLQSVWYNNHTYRNIELNGNLANNMVDLSLRSRDSLLKVLIRLKGRVGDSTDVYLLADAPFVSGKAFGQAWDTMNVSAYVKTHLMMVNKKNLSVSADTFNLTVRLPGKEIVTHNKISYNVRGNDVKANVATSFADISYNGNIAIEAVPGVLKNYFAQYFTTGAAKTKLDSGGYFSVKVKFKDIALLNSLTPLKMSLAEDATLLAEFKQNRLNASFDIQQLAYNDIQCEDVSLHAESRKSGFQIEVKSTAIHNKTNGLTDLAVTGNLNNGQLENRISFSNDDGKKWFDVGMTMEPKNPEKNIRVKLPFLLNYKLWQADPKNLIAFKNNKIWFENFVLSSNEKRISISTASNNPDMIAAEVKNLGLSFISSMLKGDTTSLTGKINGRVTVNLSGKPIPLFDVNIGVDNISVSRQPLGDLRIAATNNANSNVASIDVNFGRKDMAFTLKGTYGLQKGIPMDLRFDANNLLLVSLEPFLSKDISSSSGAINASIRISGTTGMPRLNGDIRFNKASVFVIPAQTTFRLNNQRISFAGDRIVFPRFTVEDAEGNPLVLNGDVSFANFKEIKSNLQITSSTFLAYQGTQSTRPGEENRVVITSDMQFTGSTASPTLKANVQIDENSKFFYKITKRATNLSEEGVIEFVGAQPMAPQKTSAYIIENLSLTTNLTVVDNTAISIITDPASNTGINMKAGGIFSLMQRPYQSPQLVGKLSISGGDYTLNLSGIRRKLQISDSSSIAWYGDISRPELNLKVYYQVRTSPAELMGDQTDETGGTLPFLVHINITGELSSPSLNFQLSLPPEYEGVNNGMVAAKLQEINSNESEVNQKAMALLLFGRFDFSNLAGVLSNNTAGANVLISNALNQFAAQKIKFVDLHVDMESFNNYGETTGENQRTQMTVAVSRKFMDNRLNVQLGSMFVLQGDEREQQKPWWDKINPEFNINYAINKPRSLSVQAFRKSEYRGLIEGKIIKTGVGIIFRKDFDTPAEFFKKADIRFISTSQPQLSSQ